MNLMHSMSYGELMKINYDNTPLELIDHIRVKQSPFLGINSMYTLGNNLKATKLFSRSAKQIVSR